MFLMNEVPLYHPAPRPTLIHTIYWLQNSYTAAKGPGISPLQGYLAHEKNAVPAGLPEGPKHSPTVGS